MPKAFVEMKDTTPGLWCPDIANVNKDMTSLDAYSQESPKPDFSIEILE